MKRRHGPALLVMVQGHLRLVREDESLPIQWSTAESLADAARARAWRRIRTGLWWGILVLAALLVGRLGLTP